MVAGDASSLLSAASSPMRIVPERTLQARNAILWCKSLTPRLFKPWTPSVSFPLPLEADSALAPLE